MRWRRLIAMLLLAMPHAARAQRAQVAPPIPIDSAKAAFDEAKSLCRRTAANSGATPSAARRSRRIAASS